MKKFLLPLTALALSAAVSACSWHEEADDNNTQSGDNTSRREWEHKEHLRMMTESFFSEMDRNMDGYISRKEYNDYTRRWFKEADTNHDGKLSYDEVKAQLKKDKEKMRANHIRNQNEISNDNNNDENNDSDTNGNGRMNNSSNRTNSNSSNMQ